jgi:hypothetical protein
MKRPRYPSIPPFSAVAGLAIVVAGCSRSQPSEPPTFDAGPLHMTMAQALASAAGFGSVEKPGPPPPPTDADFVKVGKREPDWDLDPTDPAEDYVERYILATQRYATERRCVHAQPSRVESGRTLVETRDSNESGCSGTNAVRDTFAVDVEHDHLELADPARGAPLADWPDGSRPGGMPTPSPKEGPPVDTWSSPLRPALTALELVPLRVQFYGRGSYPLISLAGWHGILTQASTPAQLEEVVTKVCKASAGFPVGIIATMDRSTVLRIRCSLGGSHDGSVRWEHL